MSGKCPNSDKLKEIRLAPKQKGTGARAFLCCVADRESAGLFGKGVIILAGVVFVKALQQHLRFSLF